MGSLLSELQYLAEMDDAMDEQPKRSPKTSKTSFVIQDDDTTEMSLLSLDPRKKKKEPSYDKKSDKLTTFFEKLEVDEPDIDKYIESVFMGEDDTALSNNLIMQGRKYARDHGVDREIGEIEKSFAPQEKALRTLISEIDKDAQGVQRDIDSLRMARTRNTKSLADLVQSKGSLITTKLQAIKEINSMHKTILDMNMKAKAAKKEEEAGETEAAFAVQKLLGASTSGGITLSSISGAIQDGDQPSRDSIEYSDDRIQNEYFRDYEETEGDKYIKYEGRNVEIHLQIDEGGNSNLVAIDKDGNEVPDYPLPPNHEELRFEIHDDLGTAVDQMQREYKVDRI